MKRPMREWMRLGVVIVLLASAILAGAQEATKSSTDKAAAKTADTKGAPADTTKAVKLKPEQIQSLVAPIALFPDDLLANCLAASTYPLEIVQLHQWMAKYPDLKDQALVDSVEKKNWDPSIKSLAAVPEAVKRLADDIQWTTDLGNAFLAQQSDVMDAVQHLRKKAKDKGALESNEQQKVETQTVENKTVIVVESANPEVVYVPSYSPTYIWGAPPYYPYPPIYYPPYYPGAAFISFGIGMAWGAAIWGGSCCGCGWGGNNVNINVDNNFNNFGGDRGDRGDRGGDRGGNRGNSKDRGGDRGGNRGGAGNKAGNKAGGGGNWSHNPSHRGAAPYGDRSTANKFGGSTMSDRQAATNRASNNAGLGNRSGSAGAGNRAGNTGVSNRAGGGAGAGNRGGAGVSNTGGRGTGSNSIGNRSVPNASKSNSGFGNGSRGYSGSGARSSSSRGSSSRGGGGMSRGGGGGGRGGGGGGRRG